jgi:hypothetical protein
MRDVASGKAQLGARQKGGGLKQLLDVADVDAPVDEVQLLDDDVPPQCASSLLTATMRGPAGVVSLQCTVLLALSLASHTTSSCSREAGAC